MHHYTLPRSLGFQKFLVAFALVLGILLLRPVSLRAAVIYSGQTLVVNGYYPDDAFVIYGGGTLIFNQNTTAIDYNRGTLFQGSGVVAKTGTGTISWGEKTTTFELMSDGLIDVRQGTFIGGSHGNEKWVDNRSGLQVATGAHFNGVEANVIVGRLLGGGTISSGYNGSGYQEFTFGASAIGEHIFSGVLANNAGYAGHFVKLGNNNQIFTGAHTFTGGLRVHSGRALSERTSEDSLFLVTEKNLLKTVNRTLF